LAQPSFQALAPDLRALYCIRIANRFLDDIQAKHAADVLKDSWKPSDISQQWRERLLQRYAEIAADERSQFKVAALAYAEYCDAEPDHPHAFRAQAGVLYYRAGAFERAIDQFEALEAQALDDSQNALALFMKGLCYQESGLFEQAEELLVEVAERFPASDFAPQSLGLLSSIAVAQNDYEQAIGYVEEILTRYPDWKEAPRYAATADALRQ